MGKIKNFETTEYIERTFVRRVRLCLSDKQIEKHNRNCEVQNELFNFALVYLYKTYGVKHLERPFPRTRTSKVYDMQNIIKQFAMKLTQKERWNGKQIGLHSSVAQIFLVTLYTNFGEYRKTLKEQSKLSDEAKASYKEKNNESWYRKGAISFLREDDTTKTVSIPNNTNYPIKVLSAHKIDVQDYGVLTVKGNIKKYRNSKISLLKIKRKDDGTHELQLVFTVKVKRKAINSKTAVGIDWGMYDDKVLHTSKNEEIYFDEQVSKKVDELESKINALKSKRDKMVWLNKDCKKIKTLNAKIKELSTKRTNIINEYYKLLSRELANNYSLIAIEKLNSKSMRKKKQGKKNKVSNKKLAKVKPGELMTIIKQTMAKNGITVIEVDSYKTSQVEHGTTHQEKHDVLEREWISKHTGKLIHRDYNAALNILEWALFPNRHIKLKEYPKIPVSVIAKVC